MDSLLPKCTASGYEKSPFYLIQAKEKKYVVSLNDKFRIRILLSGFINKLKTPVDLKIRMVDEVLEEVIYSGQQTKDKLQALLTEFEDVVFHNGNHALVIKNPDSTDCITFDEHGLIYISTDEDYSDILKNLGAEHRPNEKLIYKRFHWHHSTEELNAKLITFINALGLNNEESTNDDVG